MMNWCTSRSSGLFLAALFSFLAPCLAGANSFQVVRGLTSGQNVYKVVVPSEATDTTLAPGIYGFERGKANPKLLVPGVVQDVSEAFNGVIAQLHMTSRSGRNEALAIINGRLVLFSNRTSPTSKKSSIVFGDGTPLLDAVMMRPHVVQPIKTSDDVHIQTFYDTDDARSELVIVSLRQPNGMGSGLTFAFVVSGVSDQSKTAELALAAPPLILDYDFLGQDALARLRLLCDSSDCVLSRSHFLSLAQAQGGDDRVLRDWRAVLGQAANQIKATSRAVVGKIGQPTEVMGGGPFIPPQLNLTQGSLSLTRLPSRVVMEEPFEVIQRTDPQGARSGVFISLPGQKLDPGDPKTAPTLNGRLQYDPRSGRYRLLDLLATGRGKEYFKVQASYATQDSVVFMVVDGVPHVTFVNGTKEVVTSPLPTNLGLENCAQLSGLHSPSYETFADRQSHVVLISFRCDKRNAGTFAFLIDQYGGGKVQVAGTLRLPMGYLDPVELRDRTWSWMIGPRQVVAFDNIRETAVAQRVTNVDTKEDDEESRDGHPTVPFIDLVASLRQSAIKQVYMTYQDSTAFGDGLTYRRYNPQGVQTSWTGFYVRRDDRWPAEYKDERDPASLMHKDGFLLEQVDESGRQQKVVINKKLGRASDWSTDGALTVIPYTESENAKGAALKSFKLLLYIHNDSAKSGGEGALPVFQTVTANFPFQNFAAGQVVQGKREGRNSATLLLFANGDNPGVFAIPLNFNELKGVPQRWSISAAEEGQWIYRGEITPTSLKSRVIFDSAGTPYWIDTPEVTKFDPKYTVRNLAKGIGNVVAVNRPGFRAVLRYDEPFTTDEAGYTSGQSMWLISYLDDLQSCYRGLKEYFATPKDAKEKKKKKSPEDILNLFPDINNFLNAEANQTSGARQHEIVLVSPELKDQFIKDVLLRFSERSDQAWSIDNTKFGFHYFDPRSSPENMLIELDAIGRKPDRKDLLFADLGDILNVEESDPALSLDPTAVLDEEESQGPQPQQNQAAEGENGNADGNANVANTQQPQPAIAGQDTGSDRRPRLRVSYDADGNPVTHEGEMLKFDFSRMAYLSLEGSPVHLDTIRESVGPVSHRFPALIVGTPDEWRRLQADFPREARAGLFQRFNVNSRFLTGSWTVWAPNSSRASEKVRKAAREPISKDEFAIFGELDKMLVSMAQGTVDPRQRQRILVIPSELKSYVENLILTRWATMNRELNGPWSYRNQDLALFEARNSDNLTQDILVDNFESMRGANQSRHAVLLADMADILSMRRPEARDRERTFRLKDPVLSGSTNSSLLEKISGNDKAEDDSTEDEAERRLAPHAIWWMATEGRKIQPRKEKDWDLRTAADPQVPMLILATPQEMETLKQETEFESRFFNIDDYFTVSRLEKPTVEAKTALVEDLLNRPEITSLGIQYKLDNLPQDQARRQLIGLFIGRVDAIAATLKYEPTDAFTRAFVALKRSLTEDPDLRKRREIDRYYLERMYTKVFPLPLSFDMLPADDWLQKFRDPHQAARGLTERGYEGAIELKEATARNITAQTNASPDSGRRIPSSEIDFGDTSTGKTFLNMVTINYAGLKVYDYDNPNDEEASAFIITVPEIAVTKDSAKAGQHTIEEVIENFYNFLALPKGSRGYVLIDDAHKAQSKEIWQKLKTLIESLFEARDGMLTVKRLGKDSPLIKVPVRNLILRMTVNPQDSERIRQDYVKNREGQEDLVGEVMAALNRPGYDPIDRSHFTRWSRIVDFRKFPRDAKVPALLKQLRDANAQNYAASPSLVMVTHSTMDEIGTGFEDANAREFLGPTTYAILDASKHLAPAPIYIVDRQKLLDPVTKREKDPSLYQNSRPGPTARLRAEDVEDFVRNRTVQYPVTSSNQASKLRLLSLMLDNLRAQVHSGLILAAQTSTSLSGDEQARKTDLLSFLLATLDNIELTPVVPLTNVVLKPQDFDLSDIEAVRSFEDDIKRVSVPSPQPFFPIDLDGAPGDRDVSLDAFLHGQSNVVLPRSRVDVMRDTAQKAEVILTKLFAQYFRINDLRLTESPRDWVVNMPEGDPPDAVKNASAALVDLYWKFQAALYDADLEEMQRSDGYASMTIYDRARLFLVCVDRALTRLPWGHVTQYLTKAMELASSDLTISQRAGFQEFMFRSKLSPFYTVTPESVISLADSLPIVKKDDADKKERLKAQFQNNCTRFLLNSSSIKAAE